MRLRLASSLHASAQSFYGAFCTTASHNVVTTKFPKIYCVVLLPEKMGGKMTRNEFVWVYTEQSHVSRRKVILGELWDASKPLRKTRYAASSLSTVAEKYPEIKKLMGPDPLMKYFITALVIFNIVSSYFVSRVFDLPYLWTTVLAYCVGGIVNHSIILGIHELSHNVVFGNSRPIANRLFGIFANLPVGVPMSISFKKYHIEHHRYMGIQGYDVDLPTDFEGWFFHNSFTKLLWVFLQPAFYSLRPFVVRPKPPTKLEILNIVAQVVFDILLVYFCGVKALYYLMIGTLLALGLHPMAAHFIAEHYMFDRGQETYSYYGPWNYITWNVGYHMEHHDFPYIPGSRLPEVKRIAAEFYDTLPQHESWVAVIWEFIFNPEYGPYGRVKREYEDMYGEKRKTNPYLKADNTMKPVLPGDPIVELVTKDD